MGHVRAIVAELFVMAAIGIVMGLLGPFGSFTMPVAPRLAAWLAFALLGYACFRPVIAAGTLLSEQAPVPYWLALGIACTIAALPMAAVVAWALGGMAHAPRAEAVSAFYPYVLLIGGLATAVQVLLFRRRGSVLAEGLPAAATVPPPPMEPVLPVVGPAPEPPAPPFLDRLPPSLGRELLCLEMEDHYVRAHTAAGSTLLLMRMRDAVAELGGIEGARVHRSWWVARGAVARVVKRERATTLALTNGLEVPVARNELPALRAQGWL